jgi:hypothetical protein
MPCCSKIVPSHRSGVKRSHDAMVGVLCERSFSSGSSRRCFTATLRSSHEESGIHLDGSTKEAQPKILAEVQEGSRDRSGTSAQCDVHGEDPSIVGENATQILAQIDTKQASDELELASCSSTCPAATAQWLTCLQERRGKLQ